MDEYIKREDALDAVLFALCGTGHQSKAIYAVRGVPIADVVEVVRCKDCKYSRERNDNEGEYLADGVLICTSDEAADECWNPVYPSHFCSYGERKE